MPTTTTITRVTATTAALVLITAAALGGPASAKDGADDNAPTSVGDDSTSRLAADDNPGAGSDDGTSRSSSGNRARRTTRGSCTAATDWKLKAKPRDGRLEVEFEVDSPVTGQRWTYTIRHDDAVKATGARTTRAPSGSFSVERRLPNAAGVHTVSAAARNASTGETCAASLRI